MTNGCRGYIILAASRGNLFRNSTLKNEQCQITDVYHLTFHPLHDLLLFNSSDFIAVKTALNNDVFTE